MPTLSLDTNPLPPSTSTPTDVQRCESESRPVGGQGCKCTKPTPEPSTPPHTKDEWIASMRGSLAKTLARPVLARALRDLDLAYGGKPSELLAKYDRSSCSWKIAQGSLLGESLSFPEPWPKAATIVDGCLYRLPWSVPHTDASAGTVWLGAEISGLAPTLTKTDASERAYQHSKGKDYFTLVGFQRLLPTLCATDSKRSLTRSKNWSIPLPTLLLRNSLKAPGGAMSPTWAEWFMGFPAGASGSKRLEMRKSRFKPQPHGSCSEAPLTKTYG